MGEGIDARKADHIDLCTSGDVGFHRKTTLLEEVELVHDALPELSLDEVDTRLELFDKTLEAPIIVAAMTGGTERAAAINRELARIADERGYGFGLGSQRPMLLSPEQTKTYLVRDVAPSALILGNLGGVQVRGISTRAVQELCEQVGADALCVHLNPAMEIVQPGGDRDFKGVLAGIARLRAELPIPVVAKETGCGLSWTAIQRLVDAGIEHVDVSGAGGTSWVAVETERAAGSARELGAVLREWGIPTAASVAMAARARPRLTTIIATGGIGSGYDAARAIAMGATAVGMARPILQALQAGGREAAVHFLDRVEAELRSVMLLTGSRDLASLRRAPRVLGPRLTDWLEARPGRKGTRRLLRERGA